MKQTLSLLLSLALPASASAASWFDAEIAGYTTWPTNPPAGEWSGTAGATLDAERHALRVDVPAGGRLAFTPVAPRDAASAAFEQVGFVATNTLETVQPLEGLVPFEEPVKAALAAATDGSTTNFHGWAKDPGGATNVWLALAGATPAAGVATEVRVLFRTVGDELQVQYQVDGTALASAGGDEWLPVAAQNGVLAHAGMTGGGLEVSSLSAFAEETPPPSRETVVLTLAALPENVSLVSVTINDVAVVPVGDAYTVYSNATVVATFAAAEGYELTGNAAVSVVVDGDKTLTGIPEAVSVRSLVKINEIMASNPSLDKGGITNALGIGEMDWVEFYNGSSQAIDLAGWYLSDNDKAGKETKATILGSCTIPAKGYKIVWLDKIHVDPSEFGPDEAFAVLKLSSSGDLIQLADPGTNVIDKIDFKTKKQIKGYSYGPLAVVAGGNLVPGNGDPVYMKTATPGTPNATEGWGDFTPAVSFSEPHGWKTEAFDLTLSCPDDPTAAIYYTLDGSSPTTASILYTNAIPIAKTTIVRAAVPDPASVLQFDTSATYLFLEEVLAQGRTTTAPAGTVGFPNSQAVNSQKMLYGMLQLTGEDRERMIAGFTNAIPTISVVTDPGNLFNASTGVYVNAKGEGVEWERPIMLEQFDPTGVGADFSQPAGIRIRGGNSRKPEWAKHAIRFFFRSSYGESSLARKMFPGELPKEAGEYDKLDLRTSQNLSWANANSTMDTFVTEVFARDSQRDMGQPYTRSRYCHLFLNGQYWGLYQTQERGDEHWGESYLGGDSLQYDVIKASSSWSTGRLGYSIECNEGTWDAWSNLWEIATTEGFAGDHTNNYNRILGLDPDGTRNPAYPILLNAESLRSFMFSTHFMVDQDGPTSPYSSIDKGHANNFNAIRNRDDAGDVSGFVFLRHDAEVSMAVGGGNTTADKNPTYWGTENQTSPTVGSPDPSGLGKLKFRTIPYFTPAELHYLLMQNPVYAREYADAFYEFFLKEGGAMTVEKSLERYASRMAEIDDAIVCEQARWAQNGQTRSTWLSACNTATNFIKNRVGYMKSQYQSAGWYPSIEPPAIGDATGAAYESDVVPYGELVYITTAVADGAIYYTTNGIADPMDDGVLYTGGFPIPDAGFTVRARVYKNNEWSALQEVALEADVPNDQRYGIRVAAILNAAVNDPADEFIVLTNTLDRAVDLQGITIWSEKAGKALTKLAEFTNAVELAAGGTITLTQPANWIGDAKLKNGGIFVELHDFNGKRIQNAYVDSESWFWTGEYDEKGKKVCICNKTGRWFVALEFPGDTEKGEVTLESQWTTSPEPPAPATLVKINEIMASNPSPDKGGITNALGIGEMDWVEFYNGSSQAIDLAGWYLSDNDKAGKETKATILGSCTIPAKGYKIVWLDKIHVDPSEFGPDEAFAVLKLSSDGDLVQLADPGTNVIDKVDFKTKKQIKGYSYGPLAVVAGGNLVPGNGDPVYMKTATPGAPNATEGWGDFTPEVTFSEPHGYKTGAFDLTLSCADTNAAIYYTLDGSSPTTASILYTNAIPIAKTTVVRAAVPDPTSVLQFDTSATYIFLDDVLAQAQSKYAPESAVGFPDSGTVKNHKMLYGMRQDIVTGADRDRLLRGFTNSIATISLVIDPANLFNSSTGIYVNPAGRGEEWERQTMLEQINPLDPADGFSMPAGLRIRGSNSRTASRPKHALRLFFRSSYGMSSLAHKMFPGEPDKEAGEYDKIDLRCSQNSSWAGENSNADTFVHEVFSRDSQRDMGQFHTRSRYYNLFINGQYWGLYQSQERGDEHFAESYAGGDSLDWDVIKTTTRVNETTHETEKYVLEADEGTLDAWSNLWETVVVNPAGLSSDAIYQRVLGNNPDGTRNAAYPELLNPTNLMAYVLLTHYVVDGDGPVTPNGQGGPHLNNMYALYDRTDGPTSVHGFFHLRHDAEMSFGKRGNVGYKADPTGWGSGDPSTIGGINLYSDFWNTLEGFSPVKLHWELEKSAAYRRACADQFDKFFLRPGGAMTTEKNIERFAKRMAEIDDAIVCEAARWGKGPDGTGSGYSRDTWLTACRNCTNGFLAVRMPYMLSQYRARGWYPSLDTPRVVNGSGVIYAEGGEVPYLEKVYLTCDADGTTYYTLDGTDPMESGATVYGGNGFAIPDEGATIRARTLKNGEWSALEEVTLESDVPNDQRYGIRIAAILNAAVNDPADEFIVLTNTLDRAVDLQGITIWSEKAGKALTKLAEFTNAVELAAGGTITLTQPANWIGDAKLKNGGIFVELHDFNGKRIQNAYVDSESWFWTGEYDEKGKKVCVCNKTGRWFVALEFAGDTEKGEVTQESQWTTNSVVPAFPLPEDSTAAEAVLAAIADNPALGDWLVELGTNTAAGYTAITNFTGTKGDIELCYDLDILPDSNPEIELKMPSISFDASGKPVVGGELLNHGTEVQTTIRGRLLLYYADDLGSLDDLDGLKAAGNYIVLDPPTFPAETTDGGSGAPIPDARFYRLRIE